jgi:hypothetical protein
LQIMGDPDLLSRLFDFCELVHGSVPQRK